MVTPRGTVVEPKKALAATEVSGAFREVVSKYFPTDTKVKFEEKHVVQYEVDAIVDGQEVEVLVTATVKITSAPDDDDGK